MQTTKTAPTVDTKQGPSLRNPSLQDTKLPVQVSLKSTEHYPVQQFRQLFKQTNLTNKYYLAGTARTKLAYEVEEVDRNLLRLVGHANFLDRLQDEIDSAERTHKTRHKARVVRTSILPKQRSIVWADDLSDEEETSSDSEGEEEILELVRTPTRYQLSTNTTAKDSKKAASLGVGGLQGARIAQTSKMLPRILEESEVDVNGVAGLLRTFEREVAV